MCQSLEALLSNAVTLSQTSWHGAAARCLPNVAGSSGGSSLRLGTRTEQAAPLRLSQQVPDRRWMPARAAARRAFMHGLELAGDLLQRHRRRGQDNAGHHRHQPVVGWPRLALPSKPASTMPSLASRCTARRRRGAVHVWPPPRRLSTCTTSPQGWSGRIRRTVGSQLEPGKHGAEVGRHRLPTAAYGWYLDPGAQSRVAAHPSTGLGRPQPGLGALGDQRPFQLRDGAEHLQREHALRRRGVDRIAQGAEVRPFASNCSMTLSSPRYSSPHEKFTCTYQKSL